MSKRMMELQVMLEMGDRLPVPPEQIISKLEISATEKERWLQYINDQQAQQSQKQEKLEQLEIQFKDREIKTDETRNQQDFILGMAKIKQAAEKDEKAMMAKYSQMDQTAKAEALKFATQVLQAELEERAATAQIGFDALKAGQERIQDGAEHAQDMTQDAEKHIQDMRFTHEKNAIALKAAEDKQKQALAFAKQKAKEGGDNGKGKQSTTKKA